MADETSRVVDALLTCARRGPFTAFDVAVIAKVSVASVHKGLAALREELPEVISSEERDGIEMWRMDLPRSGDDGSGGAPALPKSPLPSPFNE
ncbi:MAG: hypothetical protein AAFU79_08625 [Myxococcota bacterium]